MPKQVALRHLLEITQIPTGAGREAQVIAHVRAWAKRRKLRVEADDFGNLTVRRKLARPEAKPLYFTAHLDHPAFVVETVEGPKTLLARFRGGVGDGYFVGGRVGFSRPLGRIVALIETRAQAAAQNPHADQLVRVKFSQPHARKVGDLLPWHLPKSQIKKGLLRAPACDDLAAVAAAISAYERLLENPKTMGDVRLFFTLAEEVGFIGAIGACKAKTLPKDALLINLENSKAQPEAPIGQGPIVRVGDRISVFDPALTFAVGQVAENLAKEKPDFKWQRKLMPGGACESTAFALWNYRAAALCLPLGNYHNQDEAKEKIAPEFIALADYLGLVELLVALGRKLKTTPGTAGLKERLEERFEKLAPILHCEAMPVPGQG